MLGCYIRFVPQIATLAELLTYLLNKKVPFVWGDEQKAAFHLLHKTLLSELILAYPNFDRDFTIQTMLL